MPLHPPSRRVMFGHQPPQPIRRYKLWYVSPPCASACVHYTFQIGQRDRLRPVRRASYDFTGRESCYEGTRTQLLREIRRWANGSGGSPIYALCGVAGIGKSTIAKTVAEQAAEDNVLGASFFFSRDENNRKSAESFSATLAYHLSRRYPVIAEQIRVTLEGDPEMLERDPIQQFDHLVARPLQTQIKEDKPVLLVIDALDECKENDAEAILSLLAQRVPQIAHLRVFISTRPEPHIRSLLERVHNHIQSCLHDIDQSVVEADIRSYLEFRLSTEQVQRALPDLQSPIWQPTEEQMDMLVGMSDKLFILAVMAANFILDRKHVDPDKRLAILLDSVSAIDFSGSRHTTGMDEVYKKIIHAALPDSDPGGEWTKRFQACVGAIALLHDPLPCDALAELINEGVDVVSGTLSNLHSLLAPITGTKAFRVHHKSFPGFISDPSRCIMDPQLCINRTIHNMRIAQHCLNIMDGLFDCWKDQDEGIQKGVSDSLAYACTYWASHLGDALKGGAELDAKVKDLLERLASRHLLAWLEVLSIIGRVETAYSSLDMVRTIELQSQSSNILTAAARYLPKWSRGGSTRSPSTGIVQELFNDGYRFVQRSSGILRSIPIQIYYSALPFAPSNSALSRTYRGSMGGVHVISGLETDWNPVIATLRGHTDCVRCVAFSINSSRLASGSSDCTVRIWDRGTGHNITTLNGHAGAVNSVAFSADSSRLASASDDKTIRLWKGRTGHHIATLEGHSGTVSPVSFSAKGSLLASASHDATVRLWHGETGDYITTLHGHTTFVNSVVFSPDGSTFASASNDKTIRLWDSEKRGCIATMEGHEAAVKCVAFSPDGATLASASYDRTVRLWNGATGKSIATLNGHSNSVRCVAFATDGSRLASGSDDGTVRLWHGGIGGHIATLSGHSNSIASVAFSPDGSIFASAPADNTVQLWDNRTSCHVTTSNRPSFFVRSVSFSPDGSRLALAGGDTAVRLCNGGTGVHVVALNGHSGRVASVAFSPDGLRLASTSSDNTVRLWDSNTGRSDVPPMNHGGFVNSIAFSTDSSKIASACNDQMAHLWDCRTGAHIATFAHSSWVRFVTFSPDDSRLASASDDSTVQLWDRENKTRIATLTGHSKCVTSVKFSPDDSTLASTSWDLTIRLWNSRTGNHIATLNGHSECVSSVAFSKCGSRFFSWSRDNTVLVWDVTDITQPTVLCRKTVVGLFYVGTHNSLFLLETRTDPTLCGLTVLNLQDGSPFDTHVICWFPSDISPCRLAVHPDALTAAVVCTDGRVFLLDISKALIP